MIGTVLETVGGVYLLQLSDGREVEASLRGRLKLETRTGGRVVAGDRVRVQELPGEDTTIEAVLPRRNELVRRTPGRRHPKVVAANVDRAILVAAARHPKPRQPLLDRLLVLAEAGGLDAVLVVNKIDLPGAAAAAEELERVYAEAGYRVLFTSAVTGAGLEDLRALLCAGTSTLVGPSGVGKSTLLNCIQPGLSLRTASVSSKGGTGRHTTVTTRLLPLECGGRVADTPGFSDASLWGITAQELPGMFREFVPYLDGCRFRGCNHVLEPDCAVLAAVTSGAIAAERHGSYRVMLSELQGEGGG